MVRDMHFDPTLAEIRFGFGLSPRHAPPKDVDAMLARLQGPDVTASAFPIPDMDYAMELTAGLLRLRRARNKLRRKPGYDDAHQLFRKDVTRVSKMRQDWAVQALLRRAQGEDGFRERLVAFWGDHFTAQGKTVLERHWPTPYVQTALRPLVTGRFADLLIAATTQPVMLHYLDQTLSFGPNSRVSGLGEKNQGLNENLAREVLELHSLGVNGPYTQADVRQLAELFTGLGVAYGDGFVFRAGRSEPGAEEVLGKTYGPNVGLQPIRAALTDLARHPATARHLAEKLAIHFIGDSPPDDLVAALEAAYIAHDTALMPVYATLLAHPASWAPELANVKPPQDYIATALRALDVGAADIRSLSDREVRQIFFNPMRAMGQEWDRPTGPDGWAEEDSAWITPQGLSMRMRWAMQAPNRCLARLPDPESFAHTALGPLANARVMFAAKAAETQAEAIGLVMTAPAFQRR